jgi:DNA-binding phage protein
MAKTKTVAWDAAAHLKTDEDIANYLEAVFEDGDPAACAICDIPLARAITPRAWVISEIRPLEKI